MAKEQGPVKIVDGKGVYPSALDRAIEEQNAYYGRTSNGKGTSTSESNSPPDP